VKTHVELQIDGDIGRIELRPFPDTKPPAFDQSSIAELDSVIAQIEESADSIRAVILSSASEKHFLVGANIDALSDLTADTIGEWVREGHRVFNRLEDLPFPVIAIVNGNAMGGGLELAMACDFILAGPGARFGLPEPRLGLMTGWGGTFRLSRRVGSGKARELLYTGKFIDGEQAYAIGLCELQGTSEELNAWVDQFLDSIRELSPGSIAETKSELLKLDGAVRSLACDFEAEASRRLMTSTETSDRLRAFFEQRRSRK
jgi:enoyl-CoA hydratase